MHYINMATTVHMLLIILKTGEQQAIIAIPSMISVLCTSNIDIVLDLLSLSVFDIDCLTNCLCTSFLD